MPARIVEEGKQPIGAGGSNHMRILLAAGQSAVFANHWQAGLGPVRARTRQ